MKGEDNMLTSLIFLTKMFVMLTVGALIVDYTPVKTWIDEATKDLPMNWDWSEYDD